MSPRLKAKKRLRKFSDELINEISDRVKNHVDSIEALGVMRALAHVLVAVAVYHYKKDYAVKAISGLINDKLKQLSEDFEHLR
jgi:hypothetical protein